MERECGMNVGVILEERNREVQMQERRARINGSKYGIEYKYGIVDAGMPKYIRESVKGRKVKEVVRLRCGGM